MCIQVQVSLFVLESEEKFISVLESRLIVSDVLLKQKYHLVVQVSQICAVFSVCLIRMWIPNMDLDA